jgi:hypothetical protein
MHCHCDYVGVDGSNPSSVNNPSALHSRQSRGEVGPFLASAELTFAFVCKRARVACFQGPPRLPSATVSHSKRAWQTPRRLLA